MGIYSKAEQRLGFSKQFAIPELQPFEKKVRRLSLLLLDNPAGFFESHLCSYMSATPEELKVLLTALECEKLNGFWVHPHYFHNVRFNGSQFMSTRPQVEPSVDYVINAIFENQAIKLHMLLRHARLINPADLIAILRTYIATEKHRELQHIISVYLYKHFNVRIHIH